MTLAERLQAALTSAIREQDALRRDTLRMAVSATNYAAKAARRPLSDDEVVAVLAREVKTRRESVEAYENGGRPELAERERSEIAIIETFLPRALTEDELRTMVAQAIVESGAAGPRDLGKVMAILAPQTRGRADGKVVSGLVAGALAQPAADASAAPGAASATGTSATGTSATGTSVTGPAEA
ncbi:MAG TPA: GatB/YqeY domain-containing protein [Candidatus Limnocylindrales bacterium]|nr:GatB/YqeY domain-containing protein [Candidatus Limnocylindrales bacterium]